jgi:hypothetical protein
VAQVAPPGGKQPRDQGINAARSAMTEDKIGQLAQFSENSKVGLTEDKQTAQLGPKGSTGHRHQGGIRAAVRDLGCFRTAGMGTSDGCDKWRKLRH